jgi:D-amino-acid dehydrogenase
MRILILGGGVIGVTSAHELMRQGHRVTLIDRGPKVASETSFANACLIAPGHAYAWASPRAPGQLLASMFDKDAALKYRLRWDPRLWEWSLRFLAQCTPGRARANTLAKLRLCLYSREALGQVAAETGVAYHRVTKGALYLHRDSRHFAAAVARMALLKDHGARLEAVDSRRCAEIEPALAGAKDRLAGAIYAPDDESGDCRLFTEALAERCVARGLDLRLGTTVKRLLAEGDRIVGVATDRGRFDGAAIVIALGSESPRHLRRVGLKLPIYPVKGYSVTLPARAEGAPTVPGVDEGGFVAFARIGDRLRVTSTTEFAGYDTSHREADFAAMLRTARELFPEGADYERRDCWACLRPATPDGPPIIGSTPFKNLHLNTGHGHIGWTMACGSARLLADLLSDRKPDIDPTPYAYGRYR